MKFPVLWSGITHSVLGAPVNTTCYIKKDCELRRKAVWQSPPQSAFEYIHIENELYKCKIHSFIDPNAIFSEHCCESEGVREESL